MKGFVTMVQERTQCAYIRDILLFPYVVFSHVEHFNGVVIMSFLFSYCIDLVPRPW